MSCNTFRNTLIGLGATALMLPATALAQDVDIITMDSPRPANMITDMGAAVIVGGGVSDFTDSQSQNSTNTGGNWEVRGILGTRSFIGGELAYAGSAQGIEDTFGVDDDAVLTRNGAELNLRGSVPIGFGEDNEGFVAPFGVVGINYSSYDVVNDDELEGRFGDGSEGAAAIPIGGGVSVGYRGFIFDTRVTYRPVLEDGDELFPGNDEGLTNLSWTASAGVEF